VGGQADSQGELYGGPLKNEDPPELDDVAQYTDPNTIKDMATASDPGRVSGAGQDYLDFGKAVLASGENGDLLGFLQKVAADIHNAWHGGVNSGAPGAQLQMSMLWESAKELTDTAAGLGTVLKAHGDNNLQPFHDYFAGGAFKFDTTIQPTYNYPTGVASRYEGPTQATPAFPMSQSDAAKAAQAKLSAYTATIYDPKGQGASTYDALPGYLTVTLPPGTLPPPVTKPTDPGPVDPGNKKVPGPPGMSKYPTPRVPAGPALPKNGLTPGSTPGSNTPGAKVPGTNPLHLPPGVTDPSHLSSNPPGTTPPGTTPPGTTPPGTTPPGTTPPGTTPPGTTPPVLTPPGSIPPPSSTNPKFNEKIPKIPSEKLPSFKAGDTGIPSPTGSNPNPGSNAIGEVGSQGGNPSAAQAGTLAEEAALGRSAAAGAAGMGGMMPPMMPMGGMGGQGGQEQGSSMAWILEEDEAFRSGVEGGPSVIG